MKLLFKDLVLTTKCVAIIGLHKDTIRTSLNLMYILNTIIGNICKAKTVYCA